MSKVTIVGDVHIGMKQSQTTVFKRILKESEKVILMGDIINGVTKKDKRHMKRLKVLADKYSIRIFEIERGE